MSEDRLTPDCVPVENLAEVLELGSDDPRHAHVEECPRCRALSHELESFLTGRIEDLGPVAVAADARLAANLQHEFAGERTRFAAVDAGRTPRTRSKWFVWRRPLAAAALGLVAFSAFVLLRDDPGKVVLRGEAPPSVTFRGVSAEWSAQRPSELEFRWELREGAESYQVIVYGADLAPIVELDAGAAGRVVWTPTDDHSDGPLLWRVIGRVGDEAAFRSDLHTVPAP